MKEGNVVLKAARIESGLIFLECLKNNSGIVSIDDDPYIKSIRRRASPWFRRNSFGN